MDKASLLEARELRKSYGRSAEFLSSNRRGPRFTAVDGVSFSVVAGETFAIVGESGCGKTTLARMLLRLIEPDSGEVAFDSQDLLRLSGESLRVKRRQMQMIFQDPFASLNPRMRVGEIVGEPLAIHEAKIRKAERLGRTVEALKRVGLDESALQRYPHEFSGGQRQRFGIARALILRPKLIVADEPVSALDVSVGAQVLLLLQELQQELGLTYIFNIAQPAGGGAGGYAGGGDAGRAVCGGWRGGASASCARGLVYEGDCWRQCRSYLELELNRSDEVALAASVLSTGLA